MIRLSKQPEQKPYVPHPLTVIWKKNHLEEAEIYTLEYLEDALEFDMNAGLWKRESALKNSNAYAKLSLLESGAVLASFPLMGCLPGVIQADPYTVWFVLDAPAIVPAGVFGKEIRIAAGRHLMTNSLGQWVVFFRPSPQLPTP
jgi:hypothetical protein